MPSTLWLLFSDAVAQENVGHRAVQGHEQDSKMGGNDWWVSTARDIVDEAVVPPVRSLVTQAILQKGSAPVF